MTEITAPICLLDDRPGRWPHHAGQADLPENIERCLTRGGACVFSDAPRAVSLADHAVKLARLQEVPAVLARTLYFAGALLHQVGEPLRAYVLCLEAQPLLERLDDRWRATMVLLLRGQCCLSVDEHERAQSLIAEATARFETLSERGGLAVCHELMAMALRQAGALKEAEACADRAMRVLPATESAGLRHRLSGLQARLQLERGQHCQAEGEFDAARTAFARAWAVLPPLGAIDIGYWTPHGGVLLETMAHAARAHGDTAAARRALGALARWARRWQSRFERGLAWLQWAEWRNHQGRRRAALANVRRAVGQLSQRPLEPRLLSAQWLLASMLEASGDLAGAYQAHCNAQRTEAEQQRHAIALRAELLTLDLEAEQELRKSEQTLAYAQRLSNVGHLVASVNHELNQPMASIRLLAETAIELAAHGEMEEVNTTLRTMHRICGRLADVTSKLAAFPVQPGAPAADVWLRFAVEEALSMLRSRLAQTPCRIDCAFEDVAVRAQEGQLVRVIANLVNNALDVLVDIEDPVIVFTCSPSGARVVFRVADNGPGLSESVRARLFQPFFSTKPAGQGLGLGLAMSREVMREMDADLQAPPTDGTGAVFELVLPAAGRP